MKKGLIRGKQRRDGAIHGDGGHTAVLVFLDTLEGTLTNGAIPGKGSLVLRSDGQLVRLREDGIVPMSHEPWGTHVWPSAIG
jgi:hypothetical protein